MKPILAVICTAFLFGCATTENAEVSSTTTSFLSGLLSSVAGKQIDKQTKIKNMEVAQKLGNTVSLQIAYEDLYNFDGVEIRAKVMDNNTRLPGIQSTVAAATGTSGTADLTLTWDEARLGQSLRSDHVIIELIRDGNSIKSRTFKLNKLWTALTTPDQDSPPVKQPPRVTTVPAPQQNPPATTQPPRITILPVKPAAATPTPVMVTPPKPTVKPTLQPSGQPATATVIRDHR